MNKTSQNSVQINQVSYFWGFSMKNDVSDAVLLHVKNFPHDKGVRFRCKKSGSLEKSFKTITIRKLNLFHSRVNNT
jgi:hypothetical protein